MRKGERILFKLGYEKIEETKDRLVYELKMVGAPTFQIIINLADSSFDTNSEITKRQLTNEELQAIIYLIDEATPAELTKDQMIESGSYIHIEITNSPYSSSSQANVEILTSSLTAAETLLQLEALIEKIKAENPAIAKRMLSNRANSKIIEL